MVGFITTGGLWEHYYFWDTITVGGTVGALLLLSALWHRIITIAGILGSPITVGAPWHSISLAQLFLGDIMVTPFMTGALFAGCSYFLEHCVPIIIEGGTNCV